MTGDRAADAGRVGADVLIARAYLSRVAEAGSLAVCAFIQRWGPVEGAKLIRTADVPDAVHAATQARRLTCDGEADLDAAERNAIRFIVPESSDWPHFAFAPLYRAQEQRLAAWAAGARAARYGGEPTVPFGLWVSGPLSVAELAVRSVAVVGARAATAYGEHCAAEFAYGLARQDVTVVSGGAFGIDAAVHRGALAADGVTVLVSAGGLDRPYPPAHRNLYEQVRKRGLLISESPPGAAPHKHRFLTRNRIIAALSAATVVVEAAPRSGALNTAAHCRLIGRPVMAVPGPITSALSAGCHGLLRMEFEPARLVTSVADVLEIIGRIGEAGDDGPARHNGPEPSVEPGDEDDDARSSASPVGGGAPSSRRLAGSPAATYDSLDPASRMVLDGFPARAWVTEDQLSRRSGVPLPAVLGTVPVLQMLGLIESGPGGHRLGRPVVRPEKSDRPADPAARVAP